MEKFTLEKYCWSENDFEVMGWHDCWIWSTLANTETYEYLLDLDYIFQWVHPVEDEFSFKFWVSPVTMVFENVNDVKINLSSHQGEIQILELHRKNPQLTPNKKFTEHEYIFECREGELSLVSTGYKMLVRKEPCLLETQSFELNERGGVSFNRPDIGL